MQPARKMNELLGRCTTRIGTITDKAAIMSAVPQMVVGDRVFLMFAIRRVTLGDKFPFKEKCEDCGAASTYTVDLSTLTTKKTPEPLKRLFDATLPSGKTARFRPMTGKDEARITDQRSNLDSVSLAILARLEMLDGKPASLADVKALGMGDRNSLRTAFEEVEGGVDTTVDMDCDKCGAAFSRDLDIGEKGFFFPSGMQKSSKMRSSG